MVANQCGVGFAASAAWFFCASWFGEYFVKIYHKDKENYCPKRSHVLEKLTRKLFRMKHQHLTFIFDFISFYLIMSAMIRLAKPDFICLTSSLSISNKNIVIQLK